MTTSPLDFDMPDTGSCLNFTHNKRVLVIIEGNVGSCIVKRGYKLCHLQWSWWFLEASLLPCKPLSVEWLRSDFWREVSPNSAANATLLKSAPHHQSLKLRRELIRWLVFVLSSMRHNVLLNCHVSSNDSSSSLYMSQCAQPSLKIYKYFY